jgi:nitrogen regulatory protein P-II 1
MRKNIVREDAVVEELLDSLAKKVKTGQVGDGKIFVYDVQDAVKIRTGERGESAI